MTSSKFTIGDFIEFSGVQNTKWNGHRAEVIAVDRSSLFLKPLTARPDGYRTDYYWELDELGNTFVVLGRDDAISNLRKAVSDLRGLGVTVNCDIAYKITESKSETI